MKAAPSIESRISQQLDGMGLERIVPAPMKYPRIVGEDRDQLWLRCQVDGVEREAEITIGMAWAFMFTIMGWLAKAGRR